MNILHSLVTILKSIDGIIYFLPVDYSPQDFTPMSSVVAVALA